MCHHAYKVHIQFWFTDDVEYREEWLLLSFLLLFVILLFLFHTCFDGVLFGTQPISRRSRDYKRQLNLKAEHGSSFQEEIPSGKRNIPIVDRKYIFQGSIFYCYVSLLTRVYHAWKSLCSPSMFHLGGYKLDWWRVVQECQDWKKSTSTKKSSSISCFVWGILRLQFVPLILEWHVHILVKWKTSSVFGLHLSSTFLGVAW